MKFDVKMGVEQVILGKAPLLNTVMSLWISKCWLQSYLKSGTRAALTLLKPFATMALVSLRYIHFVNAYCSFPSTYQKGNSGLLVREHMVRLVAYRTSDLIHRLNCLWLPFWIQRSLDSER